MKNKKVKQMMCDVMNGYWIEVFCYTEHKNVNRLVTAGYDGDGNPYPLDVDELVSIKANEVRSGK